MKPPRSILVLGVPRSGSTWVAEVLSSHPDTRYVHEPDNEKVSLLAVFAKRHLPRFPWVTAASPQGSFASLWRQACGGGIGRWLAKAPTGRIALLGERHAERWIVEKESRIGPGPDDQPAVYRMGQSARWHDSARVPVVKTVHSAFAAEFVVGVLQPAAVVVTLRSPYAVVSSMRRMEMPDRWRVGCARPALQESVLGHAIETRKLDDVGRSALQVSMMYRSLLDALARNPHWMVARHETICEGPTAWFRQLVRRIGLPDHPSVSAAVEARNRPDSGYKAARVYSEEIGKWRQHLSRSEVDVVSEVLDRCGLSDWIESP